MQMSNLRLVLHIGKLFSRGRRSFHALSGAGHAEGPPVHYDARLGPGGTPGRVLWATKVARAGNFSRHCVAPRRATQGHENPTFQLLSFARAASWLFLKALRSARRATWPSQLNVLVSFVVRSVAVLYLRHTALQALYIEAATVKR